MAGMTLDQLQAALMSLQQPQQTPADVMDMMNQSMTLQNAATRRRAQPSVGVGMMRMGSDMARSSRANRDEQEALATLRRAYDAQAGIDQYAAQVQALQEQMAALEQQGLYDQAYPDMNPAQRQLYAQQGKMPDAPKDSRTQRQKDYEYLISLPESEHERFLKTGGGQTINIGEDTGDKWNDKRQELAIDENQALYTRGAQARDDMIDYDMGLRLLDRVETGALSENINEAKKFANALGGDFDETKIADFEGLAPVFGKLTMAKIQETKGAVSNKEMDMFSRMNANYTYTTEGNRRLLKFAKAKAERDMKVRQMIGEMRQAGKSPMEVSEAVDSYVQENDLSGMLEELVGGGEQTVEGYTIRVKQ